MKKSYVESLFYYVLGWLQKKQIHIIAWFVFVFQEVIIVGLFKQSFGSLYNYLIHYSVNISLFYIHACWLLPLIFKESKLRATKLFLYPSVELSIFTSFIYVIDAFLILYTDIMGTNTIESHQKIILGIIWRCLYFMMFGTGYYFFSSYIRTQKEKEEMVSERLLNKIHQEKMAKDLMIAKNAYLKAQISPHFLFNTLDFIYHDVAQYSSKSGEAVLTLADIMRFALDVEHYGEYITAGKELIQLKRFIEIRRLTNNDQVLIDLSYEKEVESIKIIPLIVLTLAENMIKHGNLRQTAGTIRVFKIGNSLHITTVNSIDNKQQTAGFGSGLSNIKERLWGAYQDNARLKFMPEGSCFKVEVKIPINE